MPRLSTDKNGYIPQVPLTSTDLLAQPYATGALQAAVVDDGPASAAAKAVAATGPLTTGLYQAARDRYQEAADRVLTGLQVPAGDVYQWSMEGTPYPAFALRTADGGAPGALRDVPEQHGRRPRLLRRCIPDTNRARPSRSRWTCYPFLPSGQPSPRVRLKAQSLFIICRHRPQAAYLAAWRGCVLWGRTPSDYHVNASCGRLPAALLAHPPDARTPMSLWPTTPIGLAQWPTAPTPTCRCGPPRQ